MKVFPDKPVPRSSGCRAGFAAPWRWPRASGAPGGAATEAVPPFRACHTFAHCAIIYCVSRLSGRPSDRQARPLGDSAFDFVSIVFTYIQIPSSRVATCCALECTVGRRPIRGLALFESSHPSCGSWTATTSRRSSARLTTSGWKSRCRLACSHFSSTYARPIGGTSSLL